MFYYEVIINSSSYQGKVALTYHCDEKLAIGTVVHVPLKRLECLGIISRHVAKPTFSTKPVGSIPRLPALPPELMELAKWLPFYYPSGQGSIGQQFLPRHLPKTLVRELITSPSRSQETRAAPHLSPEQAEIISKIKTPNTYTLHGETGSGKTRVYIEIARQTLESGRSAIILTPEIALTPQLADNFKTFFGNQVLVTHSQLTEKERRDIWVSTLTSQEPLLVIGPRSALFTPLKNVGLIVMDESHEPSYKQEQSPHYLTSKVAAKLADLHDAILILGSATPLITDYYTATQKAKPILRMTKLAQTNGYSPPRVEIVDLRNRSSFTKSPHLSDQLIGAIDKSLRTGEQSLLFLNRRGTARIVLCDKCGWQALCRHCSLPLTYHGDNHTMRCHTCGYTEHALSSCPTCGNTEIVLSSVGTKAIVDKISLLFPGARVKRFDTDNKKAERVEQHYENMLNGNIDIIVGTQTIAKGLDLPKLGVVGVVIADTSLNFPDYTADERTYQLLRQVIGRVGRGHRESTVILQTYDPSNFVIRSAASNAWDNFYQHELSIREKFMFPPYCFVVKLTCRLATSEAAYRKAAGLKEALRKKRMHVVIDGPAPSLHEKNGNKYQWQLLIKAKQRTELINIINDLPAGWSYDIDPIDLL